MDSLYPFINLPRSPSRFKCSIIHAYIYLVLGSVLRGINPSPANFGCYYKGNLSELSFRQII